jgi:uracil-DNA glycosylase family 4
MGQGPEQALERMADRIRRCTRCRLHEGRRHAVPGEGCARARVMLVGEAPGAKEDESGRPFCGMSGRFLDEVLANAGMERADVFITSSVKCRPPGNRTPRADELATCGRLYLTRQIELIDPDLVVLMGKTPVLQVFGETGNLAGLHGRVRERHGRRCLPTYHPAAAMRFPGPRAAIRADFRMIRGLLGGEAG